MNTKDSIAIKAADLKQSLPCAEPRASAEQEFEKITQHTNSVPDWELVGRLLDDGEFYCIDCR